jgi:hypothetical protein
MNHEVLISRLPIICRWLHNLARSLHLNRVISFVHFWLWVQWLFVPYLAGYTAELRCVYFRSAIHILCSFDCFNFDLQFLSGRLWLFAWCSLNFLTFKRIGLLGIRLWLVSNKIIVAHL